MSYVHFCRSVYYFLYGYVNLIEREKVTKCLAYGLDRQITDEINKYSYC